MSPQKNPAAVALGKLARGKPKHFTEAERKRRSDHMRAVNAKRLAALKSNKPTSELDFLP